MHKRLLGLRIRALWALLSLPALLWTLICAFPDEPPWPTTATSGGFPTFLNVKTSTYGAVGDGRKVTDATITNGQATLTSATYAFTSADAGKSVRIAGAGAAGGTLATTVQSVTNATTAVLAASASATVSGAVSTLGTDDRAAIQAAIDAAGAAGGGVVYCPSSTYLVGQNGANNFCVKYKANVTVMGDGESTVLQALAGMPSGVQYVLTTDAGIPSTTVRTLRIDGAYSSTSNTGVSGLLWYDTDFHGPFSFAYNTGTVYSGQFHRSEGVSIFNCGGAGHRVINCADNFITDCFVYRCTLGGGGLAGIYDTGSDNLWENCIVGGCSNGYGMYLSASSKAASCKIFASGTSTLSAVFLSAATGNGSQCTNCEIQECLFDGVTFGGTGCSWVGGLINCARNPVVFANSAVNNYCQTLTSSQGLASGSYVPATAVVFGTGNSGNLVRVLTNGTAAVTVTGTQTGGTVQVNA